MITTNAEAGSQPVGPEQVEALIARADRRDAALVGLLAYGALMPRQALAFRWQDIDLNAEELTVPVGARSGHELPEDEVEPMPMDRDLLAVLAAYRDQAAQVHQTLPLFPGSRGKPLTTRSVQRIVKQLAATVDLPGVTANNLRWFGMDLLRRRIKDDLRLRRMVGLESTTFLDHMDEALRVRRRYQKRKRKPPEPAQKMRKGGRPNRTERNVQLLSWFEELIAEGVRRQDAYRRCAARWNTEHPDVETDRQLKEEAARKAIRGVESDRPQG